MKCVNELLLLLFMKIDIFFFCFSVDNDISFIINYDGKFEHMEGVLYYVGGKIHILQADPPTLFGGIRSAEIVNMYR